MSALLVALLVGDATEAAGPAGAIVAPRSCDLQQALTKDDEIPGRHPGVHVFRHPCGGTVLRLSSAALRSQDGRDAKVSLTAPAHANGFVGVARGDETIAFSPLGAKAAPRSRRGEELSYADTFPGTTLTYVPTGNGVKETLVLRDARTTRFRFRLRLSDDLRAVQKGKAIDIRRDGASIASFAAPFMTDASAQRASSDAVSLRLGHDADGPTLTLSADAEWVRRHLAHGPVSIDPTVGFAPADPDCEIQSSAPTANICSASTLGVGVTTSAGVTRKRRTMMRYTIQRWLPKGAQIYQATLFAKVTSQPTTPLSVDVVSPTKAWTYGVTWNSYDGTNAWTTAGGDYGATPVATNTSVGDTANAWESWNVTSAVQSWADTGNTNGGFGLMLKQSNESSVQGDVTFASAENGSVPGDQLDIYYNNFDGALPYYSFAAQRKLTDTLGMAVNVAGGNLLLRNRDLHVKGTGLDLSLDRYYNSREAGHYGIGWGWAFGMDSSIKLTVFGNGNVQFNGPSDYTQLFTKISQGIYAKPPGLEATLTYDTPSDTFTMVWNRSDERWTFNGSGRLTKMADRNGNQIQVGYNGAGTLNQLTDTQGRVVTFNTSTGPITSLTDSTARQRTYAYNTVASGEAQPNSLLVSSTDPEGKITKYGYGGPGGSAITTITDPRNNVTTFTYDNYRRITDIAWAGGGHTTFAYSTANSSCGGSDLNTVVTDPLGHATTYCWQAPGRVTKVIDAAGNTQSSTYTSDNQVQTFTDAASKTTTLGYDGLDNLTSSSTPGGESLTWGYTDTSHKYSVTKATNARGTASVATYDGSGNTTSVADGGSPASSTVKLEYTGQSGGVCANPLGPNGTVRCSIDANGNRTSYGYDVKGNLTSITPPVPLAATTITNDALGRVSTATDGNGQKRTYTYDKMDRVKRIDFANSGGATVTSTTFDYNANGGLLTRADITGSTTSTTSYSYDARNRKTQDTLPDTSTNVYTYDLADNLKTFTDPGGTVAYAYDSRNLPASLAEPGGSCTGTVSKCTTFAYDTRGRHTTTTYPNGVTQTWGWDDDNHLKTLVAKNSGGTVLRSFTYSYVDPANNQPTDLRFSVTDEANNKTAYGYDGLDRLTSALTKTAGGAGTTTDNYTYNYDPAGNRTGQTAMANGGTSTTTSSLFNAANQRCWTVTGALPGGASCSSPPTGATRYSYDPNGNETQRIDGSGTQSLTYNVRDQNDSIAVPGSGASAITYLGVGQNERASAGTITFHNSDLGLGSRASATAGTVNYTRTADGDPVSGRPSTGPTYYYLYDGLGSVVALTDGTGAIVRTYKYDPYGNVVTNTGSGPVDYLRYTGAYNASGGYFHLGARYYDPTAGNWTQQDALNQLGPGQSNRYAYVAGDPINLVDPSGNASCSTFGVGSVCKKAKKVYNYGRDNAESLVQKAAGAADEKLYCTAAIVTLSAAGAAATAPAAGSGAVVGAAAGGGLCGALHVARNTPIE